MNIDAVLVRHPWPWIVNHSSPPWRDEWVVRCANGLWVFNDGSEGEGIGATVADDVRDAIIELVAAHVARSTTQATHSEECWRWHLDCAVAKVAELSAASGDILLSFTAGTECRIPHHQVERLFKAVHGKDAKTPWEDDKDTKQ